jgi:phosphoenolpyruvate carboxylase
MQDARSADTYEALVEIWKELNILINELVETNQKLHILVTNLSSKKPLRPPKPPISPRCEE